MYFGMMLNLYRKIKASSVVSLALLLAILLIPLQQSVAAEGEPLTIVELYTSEGCSSCPPADAFMGVLKDVKGVLPLSFHVDYWDYLGWKDKFASPEYTQRQRSYASYFSRRSVYTPQAVIQGRYQTVGSSQWQIYRDIKKAKSRRQIPLNLISTVSGGELSLPQMALEGYGGPANIVAVYYDNKHESTVLRGENAGEKLPTFNVVRNMVNLGVWRGQAQKINIDAATKYAEDCVIILQSSATGRIIAAAKLP